MLVPTRYQIWERHPERPDRLFAEFTGYAAAVRCLTHEARDKELHATPLAWSLRQPDGTVLMIRSNVAWQRQQPADGGSDAPRP